MWWWWGALQRAGCRQQGVSSLPSPMGLPLESSLYMGRVEREVEGPGYRDQAMALAQDRMIRPGLGGKAMKHFRKMGEAELAWLAVMWRVRESQG